MLRRYLVVFVVTLVALLGPYQSTDAKKSSTSVVDQLIKMDDPRECDAIGWNATVERQEDADYKHFASCPASIAVLLMAQCMEADLAADAAVRGPASKELWVICAVSVYNQGNSRIFASPLDFTLVSARDRVFAWDLTPMIEAAPESIPTGTTVRPDDIVIMNISYVIPRRYAGPLRLEFRDEPGQADMDGIVIVDVLPALSDEAAAAS